MSANEWTVECGFRDETTLRALRICEKFNVNRSLFYFRDEVFDTFEYFGDDLVTATVIEDFIDGGLPVTTDMIENGDVTIKDNALHVKVGKEIFILRAYKTAKTLVEL